MPSESGASNPMALWDTLPPRRVALGSGSVRDIGFSVDLQQQFAFVIDGTNQQVYVLDRKSLIVLRTFGGAGHWAGQFYGAHNLAVNSKGDLFITETYEGKRVQRFVQAGTRKPD
jgi:hypothetical protein